MTQFTPDLEAYFNRERFSDVEIEIVEDVAELTDKRKRGVTIPGHSMVLLPFSNYCKVKLENWDPEGDEVSLQNPEISEPKKKKHTIELPVPAGQTDIATRLIQGMYQKSPTVSDLSQQQLLQLLLLADRFEVPKVQAAVLDALKALPVDGLDWSVALALLDLPFSYDSTANCKQLVATAEERLLQQLGDLEMVWADEQLQDKLLNLPHAALLHLLQHNQTCVASESTVVYTILQWWDKQPKPYRKGHKQQLKQLMQQVRMQHLSLLYISTHMMRNKTVLSCYSPQELAIACTCTDPASLQVLRNAKVPELQQYPAWTAAQRPVSRRTQCLEWRLPLSELEGAVMDVLHSSSSSNNNNNSRFIYGLVETFAGHQFRLAVTVQTAADAARVECQTGCGIKLGIHLQWPELAAGAVCELKCIFIAKAAAPQQPERDVTREGTIACRGKPHGVSYGYPEFVSFTSVSCWSDVEARLKQMGLVHADGCLHIALRILESA